MDFHPSRSHLISAQPSLPQIRKSTRKPLPANAPNQLLAVSLLTILFLSATIVLHCFYGLNPLLNTILNSLLLTLWTVSFGLLSWWSSSTLSHVCNRANWDDETGIMVCRVYKALFSFSLFGVVATLFAFILDIHTQRGATRRGRFTQLQTLDNKRAFDAPEGVMALDESDEANPNPHARGERQRGGEGYAVPEEQFVYDEHDTTYHGAGGQMGRRSLEERI